MEDNFMKRITTIRGDISPEQLGTTLIHEHILFDLRALPRYMKPYFTHIPEDKLTLKNENLAFLKVGGIIASEENFLMDDIDYAAKEILAFKALGGMSICDDTPCGTRYSVLEEKKLSEITGVNIICCTGIYTVGCWPEELVGKDEKAIIAYLEKEINIGMDGTDVKPGFVKCALGSYMPPDKGSDESEYTALRACAKVAAKTGMSLHIHTSASMGKDAIIQVFNIVTKECGVKPEKVLMCHMDTMLEPVGLLTDYIKNMDASKKPDLDLSLRLMDMGANISFDSWSHAFGGSSELLNSYNPNDDYMRLRALNALLEKGYASQIMLGHDVTGKICGRGYGAHGYTRVSTFVLPMLKQLGFGDDVIEQLMIRNPANLLAY
jgi:phosphotriesterase-related protein